MIKQLQEIPNDIMNRSVFQKEICIFYIFQKNMVLKVHLKRDIILSSIFSLLKFLFYTFLTIVTFSLFLFFTSSQHLIQKTLANVISHYQAREFLSL